MSSILDKVKELTKKKEELEKSKSENYVKTYYKDFSIAGKGIPMVVVVTDNFNYKYIPKGPVEDSYDLVASMISGIKGETVSRDKTLEELSSENNYIIVTANPTTVNEPTTLYIPEKLVEFQQNELANIERQIEEHNNKYGDKVEVKKVTTTSMSNDDMSISK